jgi:multidrug efflux pump subunit AcrA (membrane-fusion protein)
LTQINAADGSVDILKKGEMTMSLNSDASQDPARVEARGKVLRFPVTPAAARKSWSGLKRHWLIVTAIAIFVIGAITVGLWGINTQSTAQYVTVPIERGAITQAVTATGTVNPELTVIVGSYVSGVIQSLSCDYNTEVKAGQVCAKIDPRPYHSDLKKMEVDTNVSESDIGGLKEGDESSFTVDAFPKRSFTGKVAQVRQSPQNVQNVVTYDVVISVDNSNLALKPGMTAAARIAVDQRSNVIRVPDQALRYIPKSYAATSAQSAAAPATPASNQGRIWILRDGKPTGVPVVLGLDDDTFTEVVSGDVKPGDQVITSEQSATSGQTAAPRLQL